MILHLHPTLIISIFRMELKLMDSIRVLYSIFFFQIVTGAKQVSCTDFHKYNEKQHSVFQRRASLYRKFEAKLLHLFTDVMKKSIILATVLDGTKLICCRYCMSVIKKKVTTMFPRSLHHRIL